MDTTASFVSATVLLILVTDPLGNVPLFVSLLKNVPPQRRLPIIVREVLIAFTILLLFLFFGQKFLAVMSLSETSLGIAGGVILFLIALRMIFPHPDGVFGADPEHEPFIVPLAIPFIAGPSALATVLLMVSREPQRLPEWLAALTIAMLVSAVVLGFAEKIARLLGEQAMAAIERLMGLILTAIAVQMLLQGVENFVAHLPRQAMIGTAAVL